MPRKLPLKSKRLSGTAHAGRYASQIIMAKIKNIFIFVVLLALSVASVYRTVTAFDIGTRLFCLAISLFFIGYMVFIIFERKIKSTMLFKKTDRSFMSSEYKINGQPWNLSLLAFYTLGGYLLIALFTWAILSDNLPYKEIHMLKYIFYMAFFVIAIGVGFLTHIFIKLIRKNEKQ